MTELRTLKRRASIARNADGVTCPASRHMHAVALTMADGKPVHDAPQDVAASLLAVRAHDAGVTGANSTSATRCRPGAECRETRHTLRKKPPLSWRQN